MNYNPQIIPVPSFLLSDSELIDLRARLLPFASGDADVTDDPCDRSNDCIVSIDDELRKRDRPISL